MKPFERFWSKVDKTGDCWLWTGSLVGKGYGYFWLDGRMQRAHKVSFLLSGRTLLLGQEILHSCDNPPCVNPEHLSAGTHKENEEDKCAKERQSRGEHRPTSKLNRQDITRIRESEVSTSDLSKELGGVLSTRVANSERDRVATC